MTDMEKTDHRTPLPWKKIGRLAMLAVLIVILVISARWLYWRFTHVTTDAAYVKADMANVAPEVPGKITEICVKEGETVKQGQILIRIDPEQMDRQVSLSHADLAGLFSTKDRFGAEAEQAKKTVPAAIDAARAAVDVAERQQVKARANLDHWALMYRRYSELYAKRTIGKAKFDEVETTWKTAEADFNTAAAQVNLARARLKEAEASRAVITKTAAAYREVTSQIGKAHEALNLAKLTRSRCNIKAPIDGVVARVLVREGDFASPGRPVVGVYNPMSRYIEARFEETKVRHMTTGKKVVFSVDNLPDRELTGRILFVTPASAAEFALIPRDISAGEFTKVVQRIPVRIAIDNLERYPDLVPGMSCEVAIARN
ncbi:MAG: HlyD family secretion protein [Syntrophales bacterium]|nr:HlyD family secretion protein [Syntrophales bacterium]